MKQEFSVSLTVAVDSTRTFTEEEVERALGFMLGSVCDIRSEVIDEFEPNVKAGYISVRELMRRRVVTTEEAAGDHQQQVEQND